MEIRRLLNNKGRSDGAGLFLRLARRASIEEVVEDLAEIAGKGGIRLCSVRFKCGRLEREFELPSATVAGRINKLEVGVEGGQTQLIVKFLETPDSAAVCELEYASHLAAHRIEILAGGGMRTDGARTRNVDRLPVIDGLIGESELIRQVRQDIEIAASLDLSVLITVSFRWRGVRSVLNSVYPCLPCRKPSTGGKDENGNNNSCRVTRSQIPPGPLANKSSQASTSTAAR